MATELAQEYNRKNCTENGGVDELIVYNIENRDDSQLTLAPDGLSIATLVMKVGKRAWRLTPDMESATATQTPTGSRANNATMIPQTAQVIFKDDDDATVDICGLLLSGFFGVIIKKTEKTGTKYRHYGLLNGLTVETIEDVMGLLYEDLRGKTVNFVGKELSMAQSIDDAIVQAMLVPVS